MLPRGVQRVSRGDVYSDDYNIMDGEYVENNYVTDSGAQLKYDRKKNMGKEEGEGLVKLHVSNIPLSLTDQGLVNIFVTEGVKPHSCFIAKVSKSYHSNSTTSWGFVEFKSLSSAQAAITAVNKKPPHFLSVKFALTDEEKLEKNKSDPRDSDSDKLSSVNMVTRGRGQLPPMEGKPPSFYRSQSTKDCEPFLGDSNRQDYSQNKFSHFDAPHELNASNAVHSAFVDGYYDGGVRKVSMGRGTFVPNKSPRQHDQSSTSSNVPRDTFAYEDISDEMDSKVAAYISKRFKELTCEDNFKISSEKRLSFPFKLGSCSYCSRPAMYSCSNCKAWYCCNSCYVDDQPQHRKICSPRTLVFDKDGNASYENDNKNEAFADAEETPPRSKGYNNSFHSDRKPRGSLDSPHNKINESNGFDNSFDYQDSYSVDQSNTDNFREGRSSDVNRHSMRDSNRNQNRNSDRDQPKNSFRGQRNDDNEQNRSSGPRSNRGGRGGGARNDRKSGRGYQNSSNNEVYVRPAVSPPEKPAVRHEVRNENTEQPPIPMNTFTEITIGGFGKNKNEFFAYSELKEQGAMMKTLTALCQNSAPISGRIEVKTKVCAPFEGDWFRAEVLRFQQNKVQVFFIDFGNETTIDKKDLRPLPPDLAAKPVLAHKYILAESSQNPTLSEETPIRVKPIKKDRDGRWVVQVEGVSYNENFEEVTILVTESSDEYWVHKTCDTMQLCMMTSELGEHKGKNVEPLVDEVYAHYFDSAWCRAKVVSKNPLKVFYIDYGNYNCVNKSEIHPLPNQFATVPPLALKIKLVEGSPKACYNLKQCSTLKIKTVKKLDDGTLLCEAADVGCISGGASNKNVVKHLLYSITKDKPAKLYIEKVMNEDFLTGCIILQGETPYFKEVSDILKKEVSVPTKTMRLNAGMMVAAQWDNDWHRGYVMLIRDDDPIIALIDRGRVVIPQAVAPLPEKSNQIPESGVRAIFKEPIQNMTMGGKILNITDARIDGEKVYVRFETMGEAVLVPWEPAIEEAGLSSIRVVSGTKVIISAYISPSAIYVQSKQPEDVITRAELMQDLAAHTLKCGNLQRKPLCGEFLAVRFHEDGNYYRAQIFKKQGDRYKVTFVDYGNSELVTISDMKPLSDALKSIPCCAIKVGLKGVPNDPFNKDCMKFLNQMSADSEELLLAFERDLREVTLTLNDGRVVNNLLAELLTPSWDKPNFNPCGGEVYKEKDLVYEMWQRGDKFTIAVVSAINTDQIFALRTDSDLLIHVERNLTPRITKYCEGYPNETYYPRPGEVCLARFHEDGNWYRALCVDSNKIINKHNASQLMYLDYGNCGEVLHRCIRKMVPEFLEIPIALQMCKVYGIPESLPEEVEKKLCDYFTSHKMEAEVLGEKKGIPVLWIPALQRVAKDLGFTLNPPKALIGK